MTGAPKELIWQSRRGRRQAVLLSNHIEKKKKEEEEKKWSPLRRASQPSLGGKSAGKGKENPFLQFT